MNDFSKVLSSFLFEALVRSGKSVIDRDFRNTSQWDKNDEFRDDNEIDRLENEMKKVARGFVNQIVDRLAEEGFKTENDIITRKRNLENLLKGFLEAFEAELREGAIQ